VPFRGEVAITVREIIEMHSRVRLSEMGLYFGLPKLIAIAGLNPAK
jgi:hypothetical protein